MEINLYDSATAALVWAAESETIEPENLKLVINDLVSILIEDLRKKKFL